MANTFSLIASSTVGAGGAASFDFTSIPSTYTDLCVEVSSRTSGTDTPISVKFNNDTSNWTWNRVYGNGTTATSTSTTDTFYFWADTSAQTANVFGTGVVYIPNYAGSGNKAVTSQSMTENSATFAESFFIRATWVNSAAINRITLTPLSGNFVQYSTAYLYGVKNA